MRRTTALVVATAASLLALPGVAFADIVENNVVAGGNDRIVAGGSTTITYKIQVQGTGVDGEGGCNATAASPATVTLSVPAGVTASRSSLVFTDCSDKGAQAVTFSSNTAGSYPIRVSRILDSGTGDYTNAADFTLQVASPPPPANTKPSVAVTGAADGASYEIGSEPTPGCDVTDAEDGASAKPAVVTGTLSHGLGQLTATCNHTDKGGLAADTKSVTYTIVDTGDPTISGSVAPGANAAGWHNGDVTVSFTCADNGGSGIQSCSGDSTVSAEGAGQSVTGTATDWAGNTASDTVGGINIDKTAPVVTDDSADNAPTGTAGSNGWFRSNVTVTFRATDNLSGFAGKSNPYTFTRTTSGDGAAVTVSSGTVDDLAGNTSNSVTSSFKVDTVAPDAPTFVGGPAAGSRHYFGSVPAAPTCTSDDATSQLDNCVVSGYSTAVGQHTMTATATDNAGNTSTVTRSYTVLAWTLTGFYSPVDMGGVLNTVKGGSTVPLKFEMFSGSTELTSTSDIKSFTTAKVNCGALNGTSTDEIEVVSTGGTSLRYDATGGQFIQNWKTPTGAGICYKATMTAQDGSSLTAFFKTR